MNKNKIKTIEKNINELETGDIYKTLSGGLRIVVEKLTTLIHGHTTGYTILDPTTGETYTSKIGEFDKTKKTRTVIIIK